MKALTAHFMAFKRSFCGAMASARLRGHGDINRALSIELQSTTQRPKSWRSEDPPSPSNPRVLNDVTADRADLTEPAEFIRSHGVERHCKFLTEGVLVDVREALRSPCPIRQFHWREQLDGPGRQGSGLTLTACSWASGQAIAAMRELTEREFLNAWAESLCIMLALRQQCEASGRAT
jgi:hypothetical protein